MLGIKFTLFLICIFNIVLVIYIRAEFNAVKQAIYFGFKEFIIRMNNYVSKN